MDPLGVPDDACHVGYGTSYRLDGLSLVPTWGGGGSPGHHGPDVSQITSLRSVV